MISDIFCLRSSSVILNSKGGDGKLELCGCGGGVKLLVSCGGLKLVKLSESGLTGGNVFAGGCGKSEFCRFAEGEGTKL